MSGILIVARGVFKESVRDRIPYNLVFFAVLLMAASFLLAQLTAGELKAYCSERLAGYKVPREIEFLADLPKSAVLKILRRELREREMLKRRSQESA